ncbi:MAG TPA: PAS domain S-box protein, partial [Chroococcidiopsis sp.]
MIQTGRFQHTQPSLSLRWVLVVPFVLQLLGTVGLVGYLSYKNGQKTVVTVADQMMEEVGERIDDRLDHYLHVPSNAVAANRLAVDQGSLDPNDIEQIRRSLWQQMLLEPEMIGTHFIDENGAYIGYGRILSVDMQQKIKLLIGETLPLGTVFLGEVKPDDGSVRRFYLVDAKGRPGRLLLTNPVNTQQLPWYQDAKAAGQQTWTPIRSLQVVPVLGIWAVSPVYSASDRFEGMFTADFRLSDISTFLSQLHFSPTGQSFILERSGALVATSTLETPQVELPNHALKPIQAIASQDTRTRVITQALMDQFGDLNAIQTPQQITVTVGQQRQFVRIIPCRSAYGLDWLLVVVVPESDFMAEIHRNTQTTLWLCLAAAGGAIAVGLFTAKRVTQRITRMSLASQAMANNDFNQPLSTQSGVRELDELADSFNQMAVRVQRSFTLIQNSLADSEEKFTTIFRTSPDPLAIVSLEDGRIAEVNEQSLECFGYSRDELIGKTTLDLNLWPDPESRRYFRQQLVATGRLYNQEVEMRSKSGAIKTLLMSAEQCHLDGQDYIIVAFKDISDRKQIERSLRDSEAHQRALITALPDLLARVSRDGYYLEFVTTGNFNVIGDLPELVGTHVCASLPPIPAQQRLAAIQAALETQSAQIYEHDLSIAGTTQIEEVRVVAYSADEALILVRDISDRKQAELALQHSEERYRSIIEDQTDLIVRFLPDMTLVFVNQAYCRYFGINRDHSIGRSYSPVVYEGDRAYVAEQVQSISVDNPTIVIENRVVVDGQIRWTQWVNRALFDAQGNVVEYQSVGRDITDRKRAEIALSQSEARLQAFLRNAPTVIFEKDLEGRYVFGNREFEKVIQRPLAEVLGKTDLEVLPPHIAELFRANDRQALAAGQPIYVEEYSELADGLHTYAANKFPLLDETGQAYGVAGISVDITDRRRVELALQQSEAHQRALIQAIPDLIVRINREGIVLEVVTSPSGPANGQSQDCSGVHVLDLLPSTQALQRLDAIATALHTQMIQVYENTRMADGQLQIEEVRVVPYSSEEVLVLV